MIGSCEQTNTFLNLSILQNTFSIRCLSCSLALVASPMMHGMLPSMLELSHGRFLERLKYYAMTNRGAPEAYTTMTCGKAPGAPRQRSCLSAACRTARWAAPRSFPALTQTAATGWRGICTGAATSASPPSPGCAKRQRVLPEPRQQSCRHPEMGSGRSSHARCERSLISCI